MKTQAERVAKYRTTEKFKKTYAKWMDSGGREYKRKWEAAKRASKPKEIRPLTDGYVRHVLTSRSRLNPSDIPKELVEAERANLKLKRLWQNRKT
jgi:hypothetical protein